jgi:hypothetical protein
MQRALSAFRRDPAKAERVLAALFPQLRDRRRAVKILSDTIRRAHRLAPASWGVSLFPSRLCLNVGRGAVLQFYPGEIVFIVTGRQLKIAHQSARRAFRVGGRYRFVRDAVEGSLSSRSLHLYQHLSLAHADLVERAAENRKVCFWIKSHSPAVVASLRHSGLAVPDPDYSIRGGSRDLAPAPDLDELDRATEEGRRSLRTHLRIERNSTLAARKKQWVLATKGHLGCEVCGFDFSECYGSVGHDFAEVHHRVALGSVVRVRMTRLKHLAVVCSNCHRMLHRGSPLFSIADLRVRMSAARRNARHQRRRRPTLRMSASRPEGADRKGDDS